MSGAEALWTMLRGMWVEGRRQARGGVAARAALPRCSWSRPVLARGPRILVAAYSGLLAAMATGGTLPLHLADAMSAPPAFTVRLDEAGGTTLALRGNEIAPERSSASAVTPDAATGAQPGMTSTSLAMPSVAGFPGRIWQDLGVVVTRPLHFDSSDWSRVALGVGAVAVVAVFDNRLGDTVRAHSSTSTQDFANRIRPLGMWEGVAFMGVLFGAGEVFGDARVAATGADGLEASLFSAAILTPLLQSVVGRSRPRAGQGPRSFSPFAGGSSFPSGEATEAFTLATVVSSHTDYVPLQALAWGAAGLVGWERMELDAHWASDVVAGALIGTAVGTWVSHRDAQATPDRHALAVEPLVAPGVVGLTARLSW
jgi:membrane-associated phospholipid phosphatase